jgi:hypothetical protein
VREGVIYTRSASRGAKRPSDSILFRSFPSVPGAHSLNLGHLLSIQLVGTGIRVAVSM